MPERWAGVKKPWLAALPLPVMFIVFYHWVLPPIYGDGPYLDETIYAMLDGATTRGLFILCALGASLLLGMALATLGRRKLLA